MKLNRIFYACSGLMIATIFSSCLGKKSTLDKDHPEPNNIRKYLVTAASQITNSSLNVKTLEAWKTIRPERYSELIEMLSLQDVPYEGERSPLNVHVTGIINCDGYHIEKLYYESLPGLYVPANLYVPDSIKAPVPGILYVCGHSRTQKVHYQTHPAKFARLGFVCLIIETIQWGEVKGEHWGCYANGWFHWYSRGYTPAGVEVWNAIRGLDLLAQRPEVNNEKLGVTGISGGGAQSWFIAAADPRVKAVAPVCGASTLEAQINTRTIDGHCDCMMPINTYLRDFQDIGGLIAPRPLLICQADRDGLNKVESVEKIFYDLKKLYKLYGEEDKIDLVITPGGHSYHKISRERIFSFFLNHLMDKDVSPEEAGDIDESPESLLTEEELRVYTEGVPADDRTTTIQDSFVKLASVPEISDKTELFLLRDSVKSLLRQKTFRAFPASPPSFDPELVFQTLDRAEFGSDIFSFITEDGWRLKVDIRWRNNPAEKKPLMIVLRNYDENRWESEEFINGLDKNWNIAFFEVRGTGEAGWTPDLQWHVRRASAWAGRTIASMQVYDLLRCIEFCRTVKGVDGQNIGIAARDEMCVVALYAALLDSKCSAVILKNPPETQDMASRPDGRGAATEMLNCLRITDVYQLPAYLAPSKVIFIGEMPEKYKWSENILSEVGIETISVIENL